jgi:hypothetical protein
MTLPYYIYNSPLLKEIDPAYHTYEFLHTIIQPVIAVSLETLIEHIEALQHYHEGIPTLLSPSTFQIGNEKPLQLYKLAEYLLMPDPILRNIAFDCIKAYLLSDIWPTLDGQLPFYITPLWAEFIDYIELFTEYVALPPVEYIYGGWGDGLLIKEYGPPHSFDSVRDPFNITELIQYIRADEIRIHAEYGFIEPQAPTYNIYEIIHAIITYVTCNKCTMTLHDMTYELMKYNVLNGRRSELYRIAEKRAEAIHTQHPINCDCAICIQTHYPACACYQCYYK